MIVVNVSVDWSGRYRHRFSISLSSKTNTLENKLTIKPNFCCQLKNSHKNRNKKFIFRKFAKNCENHIRHGVREARLMPFPFILHFS